jgi:hypothetical protein
MNGILLYNPSRVNGRDTSSRMERREGSIEARGGKAEFTEEEGDAPGRPALPLRMICTAAKGPALPPTTGTAALPLRLRTTTLTPYQRRHGRPTTKHIKSAPFIPLYA